jgi:hypothetical protein
MKLKRYTFLEYGQHEPPDDEYRTMQRCNDANQDAPTAIARAPRVGASFVDFVKSETPSHFDRSSSVSYNNNSIPPPRHPLICPSASAFIDHDFQHPSIPNTHHRRIERQAQAGRAPR